MKSRNIEELIKWVDKTMVRMEKDNTNCDLSKNYWNSGYYSALMDIKRKLKKWNEC